MIKSAIFVSFFVLSGNTLLAQTVSPFKPDFSSPREIKGMKLVWNDEFNYTGKPDTSFWIFEKGFVRNKELQWYQEDNASCRGGVLLIEGRREKTPNPDYTPGSSDWRRNREYAEYTSSSIQTRGKKQWLYGRFEIRARIDTTCGAWPAIWTLGIAGRWPLNGEVDIMEFYRINGVPTILGNFAWGSETRGRAKWDDMKIPLAEFSSKDPDWVKKFHVWRMDWTVDSISIYIDDLLINAVNLNDTFNPEGFNPFRQPHYLLLNLALGANGGDPSQSIFPIKYEVDYVRVYQKK